MSKTALITGAGGQDGAFLARLLLEKGYRVVGTLMPGRDGTPGLIALGIKERVTLRSLDITDADALERLIADTAPDEVYNLAAQSSVARSFEDPVGTIRVNALGATALMEATRKHSPHARFFNASSGDMFGNIRGRRDEGTGFSPLSPYAASKLMAHRMAGIYRRSHGLFVCSGILFPHESRLRPEEFVTRKITRAAAEFSRGARTGPLVLGNLSARRDWGYAPEYVEAAWEMLQAAAPDDYVIATGESHSVREFVEAAFQEAGFTLGWEGSGIGERGIDAATGKALVSVDARFMRPSDIDDLTGDPSKARAVLGWSARTRFHALVSLMVRFEIESAA